MDHKEVRRYLNVIKRAVAYIEGMLEADDGGLLEQMAQQTPPVQQSPPTQYIPPVITVKHEEPVTIPLQQPEPQGPTPEEIARFEAARKKHVEELLAIDCWPEAVPSFLANKEPSKQDQVNRANAVLDMMLDRNVEGLSFLDYGCGEGWITQEIINRGVGESWGFDLVGHDRWSELDGPMMTTKPDQLRAGHFDIIMLYDVLDHAEDPMAVMTHVNKLLRRDGVAYVRCHPWTSKHATHLYKQGVNKAYLHLFLKWHEIADLIQGDPMFTRMEKNPVEAYHWWFNSFDVKKERMVREPVSDFFHVTAFKELLKNETGIEDIDGLLKTMEVQFVDYVLTPKK